MEDKINDFVLADADIEFINYIADLDEDKQNTIIAYLQNKVDAIIQYNLEAIIKIIKEHKNPYPSDVFTWNNKTKINITQGRLNELLHKTVEYCKKDILRELDEILEAEKWN